MLIKNFLFICTVQGYCNVGFILFIYINFARTYYFINDAYLLHYLLTPIIYAYYLRLFTSLMMNDDFDIDIDRNFFSLGSILDTSNDEKFDSIKFNDMFDSSYCYDLKKITLMYVHCLGK